MRTAALEPEDRLSAALPWVSNLTVLVVRSLSSRNANTSCRVTAMVPDEASSNEVRSFPYTFGRYSGPMML